VGSADLRDRLSDAALDRFFAPPQQDEACHPVAPLSQEGFSVQHGADSSGETLDGSAKFVGAATVAVGLLATSCHGRSGQSAQRQQRRAWL
jgi:hypothetical protein